jgi:hypothetical protein
MVCALGLAVLVLGEGDRQGSARIQKGHQGVGVVVGSRAFRPLDGLRQRRVSGMGADRRQVHRLRQRLGEEARDRPPVRRHQREHRLLQGLVQAGRQVPQLQEQLAGRVGVVERPVRPRLLEPQLAGKGGEAMAVDPREQDARDVKRVQDLPAFGPEPGRGQEVDVEPCAVADRLTAVEKRGELLESSLRGRRLGQLLAVDAGQPEHGVGDAAAGIGEALQRAQDAVGVEGHRSDFDHAVSFRVETGGLQVQGDVLHGVAPILSIGAHAPDSGGASPIFPRNRHTSASLLARTVPRLGLE